MDMCRGGSYSPHGRQRAGSKTGTGGSCSLLPPAMCCLLKCPGPPKACYQPSVSHANLCKPFYSQAAMLTPGLQRLVATFKSTQSFKTPTLFNNPSSKSFESQSSHCESLKTLYIQTHAYTYVLMFIHTCVKRLESDHICSPFCGWASF